MKAVLISIHPRHCENIASGKKTVEVRKTAPKLKTPFRCYIYETKDRRFENIAVCWNDGTPDFIHATGKILGEFVCDRIDTIREEGNGFVAGGVQQSEWRSAAQTLIQAACLTEKELKAYLGNDYGYGWHISALKIYDKPKELGEFIKASGECEDCKHFEAKDLDGYCRKYKEHLDYYDGFWNCDRCLKITRPPQSWCYVEEI